MRRLVALQAEVLARSEEAVAKDMRPQSIDGHAGGQWVFRVSQPAGESESIARLFFVPREDLGGYAWLARLGEVGLVVFTAGEHVGLRRQRRMLHRKERGHGFLMSGEIAARLLKFLPGFLVSRVRAFARVCLLQGFG